VGENGERASETGVRRGLRCVDEGKKEGVMGVRAGRKRIRCQGASRKDADPLPRARHLGSVLPRARHLGSVLPRARHLGSVLPRARHLGSVLPRARHLGSVLPRARHLGSVTPCV